MSKTDLIDFFSSGNITVISDYEGEEINSKLYDDKKKLLICGDILDSTVGGGSEFLFDKLTGKINEIQKIYNIRNIKAIVENQNIHLIFGNRDVNKFKCKFLTKMKYKNHEDICYKFNKGNINLDFKTYTELKNINFKWLADTKHWYPFWNSKIVEPQNQKYWATEEIRINNYNTQIEENKFSNNIFLKRFYRIFGIECLQGSMSAGNLLYTIPIELGITLNSDYIRNNVLQYLDYLAFIVLAVFRVMTIFNKGDPKILQEDITGIGTMKILNTTLLNGLLSRFYSNIPNTSFVSYFSDNLNDNLYIFSHGGITSTIINQTDISQETIYSPTGLKKELSDNYASLINMSGGNLELTSKDIMDRLKRINEVYIDIMNNSFRKPIKYDYKPTIEMLLALSLSAPYKPNDDYKYILNSPITPGIDIIEKYLFYCSNKNIVQIFGHIPKGFATNISKNVHNNNKTYLVNLDSSQSYKYTLNGGISDSFLLFETSNMKFGPILNSTIDLTKLIENKYITTDIEPSNENNNKFITNQKIYGKLLKTNKYIFDENLLDYEDYIPKYPDYKYHGLYSDEKKYEYYVFSTLNVHFKILVIKRRIQRKSVKDKYYKYKLKYFKLKMSLNNQNNL